MRNFILKMLNFWPANSLIRWLTRVERSTPKIFDEYIERAPDAQSMFDIFEGQWLTAFPEVRTGEVNLFDDERVKWAGLKVSGWSGKEVLEIGPMEGAHSVSLEQSGASVTAVESNRKCFQKCLIVKQHFGLKTNFLFGDGQKFMETTPKRYDVVMAFGVLYHLRSPAEFIESAARVGKSICLWTHYYDREAVGVRGDLSIRFGKSPENFKFKTQTLTAYTQYYLAGRAQPQFCGGSAPHSLWLTKDSIFTIFRELGFTITDSVDNVDHKHGPSILLIAHRNDNVN